MPSPAYFKNKANKSPKVQLQYPIHDTNNSEMIVTFTPLHLSPMDLGESVDVVKGLAKFVSRTENANSIGKPETPTAPEGTSKKSSPRTISRGETVTLYMPPQLQFMDGMQYDTNFSLGVIGAGAEAAARAGVNMNLAGMTMDAIGKGISGLIDGLTATLSTETGAVAAQRLARNAPFGDQLAGAVSSATQTTIHPNLRTLFQGVTPRQFSFTFQLYATSSTEAKAIEAIVKYFRTEMYPEQIMAGDIPIGYRYPPRWDIIFRDQGTGKRVLHKIRPSYLVNMNTSYNNGEASFHADGKPTSVDITLTFAEDRPMSKSDIEAGY